MNALNPLLWPESFDEIANPALRTVFVTTVGLIAFMLVMGLFIGAAILLRVLS